MREDLFDVTVDELDIIADICHRLETDYPDAWAVKNLDRQTRVMDLCAARNLVNLDLAGLLAADAFDFIHDVCGIHAMIDREREVIGGCFLPRYARLKDRVPEIVSEIKEAANNMPDIPVPPSKKGD